MPVLPASPTLAQHGVLGRGVLGGQVRQRGEQRRRAPRATRGLRVGQRAAALGERAQLRALLLGRGAAQRARRLVLLRLQRLQLRRQLAPALVGREQRVDRRGVDVTAPRERGAHRVRVAADQPEVEHAGGRPGASPRRRRSATSASLRSCAPTSRAPVHLKPFASLPLPSGRGPSRRWPA